MEHRAHAFERRVDLFTKSALVIFEHLFLSLSLGLSAACYACLPAWPHACLAVRACLSDLEI
jgi:hypothetical protein